MAGTVSTSKAISTTWTFFEGDWHPGNVAIMGPRTHAAWLGSAVFDGARAFEGVAPDLERHCARVNDSARRFFLKAEVSVENWVGLVGDGRKKFDSHATLYIRPMYWAADPAPGGVRADTESTRWCLCIYESPFPPATGAAITLSPLRKPTIDCAPIDAKAGCLYPNNARAMFEANARGFDNCVLLDMLGNVAELGSSNLFIARDGVVLTPAANGAFLNGITRQRVIALLRADGAEVIETTLRYADVLAADEVFSSGNYIKVAPVTRIEERVLQPGPFYRRARALYWAYAHDGPGA
ncbi:MAG: branched-chain amino acid aminotransferase [Proteobacteria bacterium]|nr:branched-chain amino acid aminotransferase [Pseudomonadota bacterium]